MRALGFAELGLAKCAVRTARRPCQAGMLSCFHQSLTCRLAQLDSCVLLALPQQPELQISFALSWAGRLRLRPVPSLMTHASGSSGECLLAAQLDPSILHAQALTACPNVL